MDLSSPLLHSIKTKDLAALWRITPAGATRYINKHKLEMVVHGHRAYVPPLSVRKAMLSRNYQYPHRVVCLQMFKGGVGKTTVALNVGLRASMYGARVLLVDLDQQANLSFSLGKVSDAGKAFVDVVERRCPIDDAIVEVSPTLHTIPSNLDNATIDRVLLTKQRNIANFISRPLRDAEDRYDLVVLDTPPGITATNTAAACAADLVVLPTNPDKYTVDGLRKCIDELHEVQEEFETRLEYRVLFNRYDPREASSPALLNECIREHNGTMFRTVMRTCAQFKNTVQNGHVFQTNSHAHEDCDALTRELLGFD